MNENIKIPQNCPSCGSTMVVVKLECPVCSTEVNGEFDLCPVCRLEDSIRKLFDLFLQARGNLKDVQRALKVSYPTARNRIEEMFYHLEQKPKMPKAKNVLERLRNGDISVEEAEKLLKGK